MIYYINATPYNKTTGLFRNFLVDYGLDLRCEQNSVTSET